MKLDRRPKGSLHSGTRGGGGQGGEEGNATYVVGYSPTNVNKQTIRD